MKGTLRILIVAAVATAISLPAIADDGTWNVATSGTWSDDANWLDAIIADGADNTATIAANLVNSLTVVSLDSARTIGNLLFSDTSVENNAWTLDDNASAANVLTLDVTTGAPVITVQNREVFMDLVLAGNDGLIADVANGKRLSLMGANTYTGTTIVRNGLLLAYEQSASGDGTVGSFGQDTSAIQIGDASTNIASDLGLLIKTPVTSATVSVDRDIVVNNYGNSVTLGSFATTGGDREFNGDITLNRDIKVNGSDRTVKLNGVISGTGGITFGGSNYQKVWLNNAANSFTGDVTLSSGYTYVTVDAPSGANGALGNSTSTIVMGDASTGAAMRLQLLACGAIEIARNIHVTSDAAAASYRYIGQGTSGVATFSGDIQLDTDMVFYANASSNNRASFTGTVSGVGSITKDGTGDIEMHGAHTYTGDTTVKRGVVRVYDDVLVNQPSALGDTDTAVKLTGTGDFRKLCAYAPITFARDILVETGTVKPTIGTYADGVEFSGNVQIDADTTLFADDPTHVEYSGKISGAGKITIAGRTSQGNWTTFSNAANDFTGELYVSQAGRLVAGGDAPSGAAGVFGNSTAAIKLNGSLNSVNPIAVLIDGPYEVARDIVMEEVGYKARATIGSLGTDTATFSGTITNDRTVNNRDLAPVAYDADGRVDITGTIAGDNGVYVHTTGMVAFSGTNTYTGETYIHHGRLVVAADAPSGAAGALGNSAGGVIMGAPDGAGTVTALLIDGPYTISRNIRMQSGNGYEKRFGGMGTGTGTFAGVITMGSDDGAALSATLSAEAGGTVQFTGGFVKAAGAVTGSSNLYADGEGTVVLATDNPDIGWTHVSNGTLLVTNTSGSATGTGAVQVAAVATLGGSGSIAGDILLLGGAVAPGTSAGTLSVGGNATFNAFSDLIIEIDGLSDYDQLAVGGNVSLQTETIEEITYAPTLEAILSADLDSADVLTILDNQGANAVNGLFDGLAEGATVTLTPAGDVESATATISYEGGDGNDVTLYDFDVMMAFILGDMDGSGAVNNNDIVPFVLALTNRTQYEIDYPDIDADLVGDIDESGALNNNDITPFVELLTSGSPVPEPMTMVLLALGGVALLRRRS